MAANTFSDYLENVILDLVYGGVAYTPPATLYIGVHLATALAAASSVGAGTISTTDSIPVGSSMTINAGQAGAETRTVTAVTGTGPYTITFSGGTLATAHAAGEPVAFDPSDAGLGVKEPSGGGYARLAVANNATNFPAAAGGSKALGVGQNFPQATANWGWQTHLIVYDALTGGHVLSVHGQPQPQNVVTGMILSVPASTGLRQTLD